MKVIAFIMVVAGAVLIFTGYKGKTLKEALNIAE
jgi:hypothetical protein